MPQALLLHSGLQLVWVNAPLVTGSPFGDMAPRWLYIAGGFSVSSAIEWAPMG